MFGKENSIFFFQDSLLWWKATCICLSVLSYISRTKQSCFLQSWPKSNKKRVAICETVLERKMLSSMQEFFFLQKVSKIFSQCKSFTKEKVFLCSMQVARLLSQPWAICQGSRNRSQNRSWNFFLSCFWANEWPEKKKSFFFVKVRPRRVFHKNSGARTCLRTRPKCSQSKQTLKKRSPFVYHTQRKHGKLNWT